EHHFAKH
ncbi:THUMP domain protein, partial [Vibrio parahaemolyticus AQ3810]